METTNPNVSQSEVTGSDATDTSAMLRSELNMIERTATAAHRAIDRFASQAQNLVYRARDMASQTANRFRRGCRSYSQWEDECVELTRERIRAKPLTAVAIGLLLGVMVGRMTRS